MNPFTPELPVRIHVPSTACDVVSFKGQGQLCNLSCSGGRDLSNRTKISMIQSRRPKKKAKNPCSVYRKSPWKTFPLSTYLPSFHLKASPKTFHTRIQSSKCTAKEKKLKDEANYKSERRRRRESEKCKTKLLCHFNPKKTLEILQSAQDARTKEQPRPQGALPSPWGRGC